MKKSLIAILALVGTIGLVTPVYASSTPATAGSTVSLGTEPAWSGDPQHTAILIIDMQQDPAKIAPEMTTPVLKSLEQILPPSRAAGIKVFYIGRAYRLDGSNVEPYRLKAFQAHPFQVVGTTGADFISSIKPQPQDWIIHKNRADGFMDTYLNEYLSNLGIKNVIITGVQTPVCVRATAISAMEHNYAVTMLSDATASQSPAVQAANLSDMAVNGVAVMSTADFLKKLKDVSK